MGWRIQACLFWLRIFDKMGTRCGIANRRVERWKSRSAAAGTVHLQIDAVVGRAPKGDKKTTVFCEQSHTLSGEAEEEESLEQVVWTMMAMEIVAAASHFSHKDRSPTPC